MAAANTQIVKVPVKPKQKSAWEHAEPFVLGGLSGMFATAIIQPMDMVKVRIQLSGEGGAKGTSNPLVVARQVIAQDGVMGLYNGLSAGLLRQATYTTARLGIFRTITNYMDTKGKRTFWETAGAGILAGGLGAVVGTPADLALIRMQSDGTLPPEQRRNYKGVGNALVRIVREEGFTSMFKGCVPVVTRACALNLGMLAGHDATLDWLKTQSNSPLVQTVGAKAVSGFFASAFSLPFDFVKTRIQKQKPDATTGALPYRNSLHCVQRVLAEEGPFAFYRGFWTYYFRIAPHVMITLFTLDALNISVKNLRTQYL